MPLFSTRTRPTSPPLPFSRATPNWRSVLGQAEQAGQWQGRRRRSDRRLLEETGSDWDRRGHRASVLAEAAAGTGRRAQTWLARDPHDVDALVFHSLGHAGARSARSGVSRTPRRWSPSVTVPPS
ncbi:hypothetical protein GCM10019016_117200 [Streptomyces prasinosporus]|uniref:Uncharacterized protein n=1 Tax=Streptomyces prasinosporus TaxID=68256 RepID=A0ABP6UA66_9ACTN